MDKKPYRTNAIYGIDTPQQNINNRVGDGKNGIIPAPLSTAVMSPKPKRNTATYNAGNTTSVSIKNNNNNSKSKTTNNITNSINSPYNTTATTNNNKINTNHTHGANNNRTATITGVTAATAAAVGNLTSQPKQVISPVNAKSNMVTARMKNEEAVNDLRQRIPEIEKIFDVHTRIGNGTFSTVLLGTLRKERNLPEESRRKFAIKHHIPTSHPERIMRELQCMASIGGVDNVVGINCCMRCNESVAFIMPYMPHDRFHDFFNKMDLTEVQNYMKNLLQALRRVHRFNIIHRDVKPSNFLYNRSKRQFLLVDFGLAQQAPTPQKHIEATSAAAAAAATHKSTQPSARLIGGGGGEGNKRAREHDDDEDNEGMLKSCLDTNSDSTTTTADVRNGDASTLISGVSKRLRCTGPEGDQQVAAAAAAAAAAKTNSISGGNGQATFKMPLKQINEINDPNSKMTSIGGVNASNVGGLQSNSSAVGTPNTQDAVAASKYNTNRNLSAMNAAKCFCYGNAQVCNICLIKKEIHASRAGTPGYRPPEVLLKYADQTTAVDIWAAGVIFLSILSSVYPFFKAPNDFVALAEMVTIFGDQSIRSTACLLDRLVTLSQRSQPLDLRKLCVRFRNRAKFSSPEMLKKHQRTDGSCEICDNCDQYYFNCLCSESQYQTEPLESDDPFPPSAYDLLYKLLEVNPHKRITAEQALQHPFFRESPNMNAAALGHHNLLITAGHKSSPLLAKK